MHPDVFWEDQAEFRGNRQNQAFREMPRRFAKSLGNRQNFPNAQAIGKIQAFREKPRHFVKSLGRFEKNILPRHFAKCLGNWEKMLPLPKALHKKPRQLGKTVPTA